MSLVEPTRVEYTNIIKYDDDLSSPQSSLSSRVLKCPSFITITLAHHTNYINLGYITAPHAITSKLVEQGGGYDVVSTHGKKSDILQPRRCS